MFNSKHIVLLVSTLVLCGVLYVGYSQLKKVNNAVSGFQSQLEHLKENNKKILIQNIRMQKQIEESKQGNVNLDELNISEITELIQKYENKLDELSEEEDLDDEVEVEGSDNEEHHNVNPNVNHNMNVEEYVDTENKTHNSEVIMDEQNQYVYYQTNSNMDMNVNMNMENNMSNLAGTVHESINLVGYGENALESNDQEYSNNVVNSELIDELQNNASNLNVEDEESSEEIVDNLESEDNTSEDESIEVNVNAENNLVNSSAEIQKIIRDYYYKKTNNELKELLRIYNKSTKGNKINLVNRVLEIEEYNNINLVN